MGGSEVQRIIHASAIVSLNEVKGLKFFGKAMLAKARVLDSRFRRNDGGTRE